MPPPSAKICGITDPRALDAAVAGGASHVGFVFYPPSPRNIAPGDAAMLAARVPAHVGRVGVFADAPAALIEEAVRAARLTVIQLHGAETPAHAQELRARFPGLEIWKAAAIRTAADLAGLAPFRGPADRALLDAKPPAGAKLPGGNGLRFDWTLLGQARPPLPWILSGGLDPSNVADAVRITGASFVDVSSGVEDAPGAKSPDKITAFLSALRTA